MKRYKFRLLYSIDSVVDVDEIVIDDFEHPDGEWVKYEDVEKYVNIAQLKPGQWDPLPITLTTIPVCNCELISQLIKSQGPIEFTSMAVDRDWICPAHGYKTI